MGKSTPAAPAAPDYAAAATAQGAANLTGAAQGSSLSNPNIISPYGNQTVTWAKTGIEGAPQGTVTQTLTPAAQATLDAQQQVQTGTAQLGLQGLNQASGILSKPFNYNGPDIQTSLPGQGPLNYGPAPGQYGMAGSVDPSSFGANTGPSGDQYGQAGGVGAGQYGMAQGGVSGPNLQSNFGEYGNVQNAPSAGQYGQASGVNADQYGNLKSGLDLSNVAAMPVNAGMTGQQAIMSRLQPQIDQQAAATAQRLANQGITPGSEAYNNEMRTQGQQQNDLYTQAALQGIGLDTSANQQGYNQALSSAGLYNQALGQGFGQASAASQMGNQAIAQNYSQGLQANAAQNAAQAQQYSQAANNAQFGNAAQLSQFQSNLANQQAQNQAIGQNFGQGTTAQQLSNQAIGQNYGQGVSSAGLYNTAMGQNYNQALGSQQLGNQAIGQNYGQGATSAGLYNQAAAQRFNQNLGAAQFGNSAAVQSLQQQLGLYNQPLNQINALMSSSQIQNPQFQQYTGQNVAAAPVFQAAQAQNQAAMDVYGQQMAARNANVSAMGDIASAGIGMINPMKLSDIRLKSNIVKVGDHPLGIGIYEYDIFGQRDVGVMAQDVLAVKPEAIVYHPSGYMMVDYGAL